MAEQGRVVTPKDISAKLRKIQDLCQGAIYNTQDIFIDISAMAKDAADAIDALQIFVDFINKLPQCNDCINPWCNIRPALGKTVRYNCAFYMGVVQSSRN